MHELKERFPPKRESNSTLKRLARKAENQAAMSSESDVKPEQRAWYRLSWPEWVVLAASLLLAALLVPRFMPEKKTAEQQVPAPEIGPEEPVVADGGKKKEKKKKTNPDPVKPEPVEEDTPKTEQEGGTTPEGGAERPKEVAAHNKDLKKKLQRKISLEFVDTPLKEAMDFIAVVTQAKVKLDPDVKNVPINLRVQGMKAENALQWMLKLAGCEYKLDDGLVRVSTNRKAGMASVPMPKDKPIAGDDWKKEIRAKLQKRISFEFVDTPLTEALGMIVDETGVKMSVDAALAKALPINLRVKDMKADLALDWLLRLTQARYILKDRSVVVLGTGEGERLLVAVKAVPAKVLRIRKAEREMGGLIRLLAHDDFNSRVNAEKKLLAADFALIPALQAALAKTSDPETRLRLNRVVKAVTRRKAVHDDQERMRAALAAGKPHVAGFATRFSDMRPKLLALYAGNKATESAVDAALRWLAYHQEPDGRWDVVKWGGKKADVGITGLCILAFLGKGHTEKTGKYQKNVRLAIEWLREIQREDGSLYVNGETHGVGYHHGIAGLALVEAAGMCKVPETVSAAQKAVDYSSHTHQGRKDGELMGWRYQPGSTKSDTSVSGWYIKQLTAAKAAGLSVSAKSLEGAVRFLDSVESKTEDARHRYGYTSPQNVGVRRTAIGCLSRQLLGTTRAEVQPGVEWMIKNGGLPKWGANGGNVDLYYWYYATLCAFHQGGDIWTDWNNALKMTLVDNQRKGGDEDGSWDPVGAYAGYWGRAGQTALGALCLETYYRYPRLSKDKAHVEKKPMKRAPVKAPPVADDF